MTDVDDLWEMAYHDRADEAFERAVAQKVWDVAAVAARIVTCSGCYDRTKERAHRFLATPVTERETFQ